MNLQQYPPHKIAPADLSPELLHRFGVVTWAEPLPVTNAVKTVRLQVTDLTGAPFEDVVAINVFSNPPGPTLTNTELGQGMVMVNDETSDLVVLTDSAGAFDLQVTANEPGTFMILAGPTGSSHMLDCSSRLTLEFVE